MRLDLLLVSVLAVLELVSVLVEPVLLLPVLPEPVAPMLLVPPVLGVVLLPAAVLPPVLPAVPEPVVELELGLVVVLPLPDVPLLLEPGVVVALEPEPVVPEPLVDPPEVWAMANPPIANAAAAASVVRVFLVVLMSNSLNGNPEGSGLKKAGKLPTDSQPTVPSPEEEVGLFRHSL